eukprot:c53374_g1_i1.p1 GENE.c53374_g1_i1~~c53374_g1_i1.p1  ORF type:complete len:519 (+),score=143.94 c53374_g1_i1:73-1629(+)
MAAMMAADSVDDDYESRQSEVYQQKCAALEKLYHEVHELENKLPARRRKRLAALDSSIVGDDAETLARIRTELAQTLEKVDQLFDRNKALDELAREKTSKLDEANAHALRQAEQIQTLQRDIRVLESTKLKLQDSQASTAAKAGRSAAAGFKDTPDESYFVLLDNLENEIKTKDAEIKELWKDRKTMDLEAKRKDAFIDKLQAEARNQAQSFEDVAQLDGKVRELQHKIEELVEENKLLNNLCRVKTSAIEKLQLDVEARVQSEEYVRQLEAAVRNKERVIQGLQESLESFNALLKKRDEELDQVSRDIASSSQGLKFKEWYEERRALKAEIERAQEIADGKEKIVRSQHQRINQLAGRLETLSRSLAETAGISPRHAGMMATPRRPGGGVFVDEDGQELVAAELFDALARDVHIMRIKLQERESLLEEKDDVIECWERKNEILSKTHAQEAKTGKRQTVELRAEVENLRAQLAQRERDVKEREQQVKMEAIKLKKELLRARRSQATNVSRQESFGSS